jgi:hypothetical protein
MLLQIAARDIGQLTDIELHVHMQDRTACAYASANAAHRRKLITTGITLAVGTFKDHIGRMRRIVRGQEIYGGRTPSEQATAYNSRLNADAWLSQPQHVSRWRQLVNGELAAAVATHRSQSSLVGPC